MNNPSRGDLRSTRPGSPGEGTQGELLLTGAIRQARKPRLRGSVLIWALLLCGSVLIWLGFNVICWHAVFYPPTKEPFLIASKHVPNVSERSCSLNVEYVPISDKSVNAYKSFALSYFFNFFGLDLKHCAAVDFSSGQRNGGRYTDYRDVKTIWFYILRLNRISVNPCVKWECFRRAIEQDIEPDAVKLSFDWVVHVKRLRRRHEYSCAFLADDDLNIPVGRIGAVFCYLHRIFENVILTLQRGGLPLEYSRLPYHDKTLPLNGVQGTQANTNADDSYESQCDCTTNGDLIVDSGPDRDWWHAHDPYSILILSAFDCGAILVGGLVGGLFLSAPLHGWRRRRARRIGWLCMGCAGCLLGIGTFLAGWGWAWGTYLPEAENNEKCGCHGGHTVPQKYLLTIPNYWGTVIAREGLDMANVLSTDKQIAVIGALAEGSAIRHLESVSVKETFRGKMVWEGAVEVFELIEHPKASRLYAWIQDADGKKRHFTVLHVEPVDSPQKAVQAAILQDYRDA